jgi:hypothetical protein
MEEEFYDYDGDVTDKDWEPPQTRNQQYDSDENIDYSEEQNLYQTTSQVNNENTKIVEEGETVVFENIDH